MMRLEIHVVIVVEIGVLAVVHSVQRIAVVAQRDIQIVAVVVTIVSFPVSPPAIIGGRLGARALATWVIGTRTICVARVAVTATAAAATATARSARTLFARLTRRRCRGTIFDRFALFFIPRFDRFVDRGGIDVPYLWFARRRLRAVAPATSAAATTAATATFAFAFVRGFASALGRLAAHEELERLLDLFKDEAAPHLFHFERRLGGRRLTKSLWLRAADLFAMGLFAPGGQRFRSTLVRLARPPLFAPLLLRALLLAPHFLTTPFFPSRGVVGMTLARRALLLAGRLLARLTALTRWSSGRGRRHSQIGCQSRPIRSRRLAPRRVAHATWRRRGDVGNGLRRRRRRCLRA